MVQVNKSKVKNKSILEVLYAGKVNSEYINGIKCVNLSFWISVIFY